MSYLLGKDEYATLYKYVADALGAKDDIAPVFPFFTAPDTGELLDAFGHIAPDFVQRCNHRLKYTLKYIRNLYPDDYRRTMEVLVSNGGHCDCEVLMNVDVEKYVRVRYEPVNPGFDEWEWKKIIDDYILYGYRMPRKQKNSVGCQQLALW